MLRRLLFSNAPKCIFMATRNGLEPSTSSVTGWRANRLHHRAIFYGGNNRARTCDPMLVRHVLSQLSYAPEPLAFGVLPSATWFIIHKNPQFVKHFFRFFLTDSFEAFSQGFPPFLCEDQSFFRISRISSGVKVYTVSQNWHSTGKLLPSSRISRSSCFPRLISARSTRSREQ